MHLLLGSILIYISPIISLYAFNKESQNKHCRIIRISSGTLITLVELLNPGLNWKISLLKTKK